MPVTLGKLTALLVLIPPEVVWPVGVMDRPFTVLADPPALAFVKVNAARLLEPVKELSARVKASVAVLVEVSEVLPKPVRAMEPEVPVRLKAPEPWVYPVMLVRAPALVMRSVELVWMVPPVVLMFPEPE